MAYDGGLAEDKSPQQDGEGEEEEEVVGQKLVLLLFSHSAVSDSLGPREL